MQCTSGKHALLVSTGGGVPSHLFDITKVASKSRRPLLLLPVCEQLPSRGAGRPACSDPGTCFKGLHDARAREDVHRLGHSGT